MICFGRYLKTPVNLVLYKFYLFIYYYCYYYVVMGFHNEITCGMIASVSISGLNF